MAIGRLKAKQDYTKAMLPINRREIFWDVVRLHWKKLLILGCVFFAFLLPLLILQWLQDLYMVRIQSQASGMNPEETQGLWYTAMMTRIILNFAGLPFWAVLGLGMAGFTRVIRQYAWMENVHTFADFIQGVRDNGKHMTMLGLLLGFVCAMCINVHYMLPYGPEYLSWISLLQTGITLIFILPMGALCLTMIPVYANPLKKHLAFALLIYLKSPVKCLCVVLGCMLILVPMLIPILLAHVAGGFLIGLLGPYVLLAWTLYSYDLFDIHINTQWFPHMVGKGILGEEMANNEESEDILE